MKVRSDSFVLAAIATTFAAAAHGQPAPSDSAAPPAAAVPLAAEPPAGAPPDAAPLAADRRREAEERADDGSILWESVLGLDEALPEGNQRAGDSGSAGPSVTAGGLVFVGATNDRRFRAFDARTGRELWSARLPNAGNANPMSYSGTSGKQHVAIVAGDTVNAFSLP